jgi:hypothetical protein
MEDATSPNKTDKTGDGDLLEAIIEGRTQARQRMTSQQRRLGDLEGELAHRIGHISQELARARKANLDTEAELVEHRSELEATAKKLRLDERGLAQLRRECEASAEDLAYHRQRVQQKLGELEVRREQLDEFQAELKSRRQRIAHQLKSQRQENRQSFEREQAELDRRREALGETEALAGQLAEAERRLVEVEERQAAADRRQPAAAPPEDQSEALADMKRRYELALEDLREQKRKVAELQERPAPVPRAAAAANPNDRLDWESQKQRMLAALEADVGEEDEASQAERLKIREVISRTDAVVAGKDREIEDLQELLAAQAANLGEVAVGASAFAEMLSGDEIVRTERERLQQLQREWEEKLRQAEIDLSVQRAKIARDRAEIEERQRVWQQQQTDHGPVGTDMAKSIKPQRGRWLTRLGLKEDES